MSTSWRATSPPPAMRCWTPTTSARPTCIRPGQIMKVPVAKAYVARTGDTLAGVAQRFSVSPSELAAAEPPLGPRRAAGRPADRPAVVDARPRSAAADGHPVHQPHTPRRPAAAPQRIRAVARLRHPGPAAADDGAGHRLPRRAGGRRRPRPRRALTDAADHRGGARPVRLAGARRHRQEVRPARHRPAQRRRRHQGAAGLRREGRRARRGGLRRQPGAGLRQPGADQARRRLGDGLRPPRQCQRADAPAGRRRARRWGRSA